MPTPTMFKLNYPVETKEARKFWASKHVCNRVKAIIAFSRDLSNANDNLRRAGYANGFRKRAVNAWKHYVNMPAMDVVPFTPMGVDWWDCIPLEPMPPAKGRWVRWDDAEKWLDPDKWTEWEEFPTKTKEELNDK